jgi:site-specific DNA-methyltransferase (adenine-specific)
MFKNPDYTNKIICSQCEDIAFKMPEKSVDLIVTSPPYNIGQDYDGHEDSMELFDYIEWLGSCFEIFKPTLKDDARICINIADSKNGSIPIHIHLTQHLLRVGYNYYTTIVWDKYQVGNRLSWGSYNSPSCPSFPTQFEFILVFYNKEKHKEGEKENITLSEDGKEFQSYAMALWQFSSETNMKKYGHPAMFPVELPYRCMQMFSYKGDLVFDPFCGLGTTAIAAHKLGRKFICCDKNRKYVDLANRRLFEEKQK